MTYRDNDVYFALGAGYALIGGVYTVTGYSITNGQDPDGHIYAGLKVSCGSDGKMTFSIGRKGSEDVANWFNTNVAASQTTFNHTAGELNFAFLGTLELTISGGILGGNQQTFTFYNVALAQGHSGASNNWWFGGQNCAYIQNNQVSAQGVNAQNGPVSFVFLRGGNDVSTVGVTPNTFVDTTAWMSRIADSTLLNQLIMPGSHDAGMSDLSHCAPPLVGDGYTRTQSGSIGQQLVDGSRYFDIRVDYDYDALVTYHRTDGWGCNGVSLLDVLNQTQAFLTAHPSETAIFKFSHIRDYDGHDPAATKQKINALLDNYTGVMYQNGTTPLNLAQLRIGDLRGKMILAFDYDDYIDPATGRFRYADWPGSANANLTVFDQYSDSSDYETMKRDQLAKWSQYGGQGKDYLFLLSWTLTASPPGSTIQTLAAEANANLPGVLSNQILEAGASKPNIVYIDFVANPVTQSIIQYNFL